MQNILVVDDEENIRHMLTLVLRKEGYQVTTATHGEEALKLLLSSPQDMVLCDVRMPRLDGHGLLQEIQNRSLKTTVIMMSAYGDKDTALQAIKHGAYDYISKPFKRDEVLLTLQKAEERERLRRENLRLKEENQKVFRLENIIARSSAMKSIFDTIRKISGYNSTVLLSGESGTGKELIARAIHTNSNRANGPWVAVNCGAIPENLLESELFGHIKGAFTDASRNKIGLFQQAHKGTIFLDEIAELPLNLQVKLLRVIQEREIRRLGCTKNIPVDVRIIAASHKNLDKAVQEGRFREDLFYRLNVLPLQLPPLRDRREDIPLLIDHFIERYNQTLGTSIEGPEAAALKSMLDHPWPGNVRELENTIERALILSDGPRITTNALPPALQSRQGTLEYLFAAEELSIKKSTRKLEKILIKKALERTGGNRTRACELLDISHRALLYKIKDYGLN